MNNVKRLLAAMLVLSLALCLCACGNEPDTTTTPAPETTPSTAAPVPTTVAPTSKPSDGKVVYTVIVVDNQGNPMANVLVQICKDVCYAPTKTNESGIAEFRLQPSEGYKAQLTMAVEGYTAEEAYYFAEGATEVTITLTPVAG